jgi:hypothetical protein
VDRKSGFIVPLSSHLLPFAFRTDDLQAILRGHQPAPPENRKASLNTKPRGLFGETRGLWGDRSMASLPEKSSKRCVIGSDYVLKDHFYVLETN